MEARNAKIILDVSCTNTKYKAEVFNRTGGAIELKLFRIEKCCINQALKNRNLAEDIRNSLITQWKEIDDKTESVTLEQKRLKADASAKRKSLWKHQKC